MMEERNLACETAGVVSLATTLRRTAGLVGLTLLLVGLVRFLPFVSHGVQWVAGTKTWQSLYPSLNIETSLGQEQLILIGIVGSCFIVALGIQGVVLFLVSGVWRLKP